jgi:sugar (pentulose or hexulose) kinase
VQKRVSPDPRAVQVLAKQYQNYRQLYPALKPLFAQMS